MYVINFYLIVIHERNLGINLSPIVEFSTGELMLAKYSMLYVVKIMLAPNDNDNQNRTLKNAVLGRVMKVSGIATKIISRKQMGANTPNMMLKSHSCMIAENKKAVSFAAIKFPLKRYSLQSLTM
jgi:hypothetical protein